MHVTDVVHIGKHEGVAAGSTVCDLLHYVRLLLVLCICSLLIACGARSKDITTTYAERNAVADIKNLSQDPTAYLTSDADVPMMTPEEQAVQFAAFKEKHFAAWRMKKVTKKRKDAFWGTYAFTRRTGYAENLLPWSKETMNVLVEQQNIQAYPSMCRYAITVRHSSLRILPTIKPYFKNPELAGEGFPFDYFQNSAVHTGTPLFVTHSTVSGEWVYAETAYASGWIPVTDIAYVTSEQKKRFMKGALHALTYDDISLHTTTGRFLSKVFVGAAFPEAIEMKVAKRETELAKCPTDDVTVLVPSRDLQGNAHFFPVAVSLRYIAKIPAILTPRAMATLASHIVGQRYGWGGLFENRDCSSTMRDLFTLFGVWLPRNSRSQAARGAEGISLKDLTPQEKRKIIIEKGIPFFSLIAMKGHIGLYIGQDPATCRPLLLHDIWGVRTFDDDREGRAIIGCLCITTLRLGEERSDVKKDSFYNKLNKLQVKPGTWK